jgi:polar amino acid transport system substrate-binding protein
MSAPLSTNDIIAQVTRLMRAIAFAVAFLPVTAYWAFCYLELTTQLESELKVQALVIDDFIANQPETWDVSTDRILGQLDRYISRENGISVFNKKGEIVAQIVPQIKGLFIKRSRAIYDFGVPVGSILGQAPFNDHILQGLAVFGVSLVVAGLLWGPMRRLPLDALAAADSKLKTRDRYQRTLLDNFPFIVWLKDIDGQYLTVNAHFLKIFKCKPEYAHINNIHSEMENAQLHSIISHNDRLALASGEAKSLDEWVHIDGQYTCFSAYSSPVYLGNQIIGTVGYAQEITERKRAQEALRASERLFSELIRYSFDSITILDAEGIQVFVSEAVERMLGYKASELIGIPVIKEMIHPDDQEQVMSAFGTILEEGRGGAQYRHKHKNGSWVYLEAWGTNQLENPDIRGVVVNVREINERKLAEQALQASEEQFRSIVETSPMGMHFYRLDDSDRLILVAANPASDRLLGIRHSELVGLPIEAAFPGLCSTGIPEMYRKVALGQLGMQIFETSYNDEKISGVYEVYVFKTGDRAATTLYTDITERKKIQELMIQTEKMMSVGGLAAGMAHEINNPLSGIMQNVQVMMQRLTMELPVNLHAAEEAGCSFEAIKCFMEKRGILTSLESVRQASMRAAHIVASMLEFSRKSTSNHTPVNLNVLLDKTLELCSTSYDPKKQYDFRSIRIVRDYDPVLPFIPCIETQIQQVFMNILTNAAQAMAAIPDPTIILRTVKEEEWACIEIEDNGPGMTEDVRKHVFEPFYTTKPVGEGTGLGLSVSYFIVVNHHYGTIDVNSVSGKGTKFIIRLPLEKVRSR